MTTILLIRHGQNDYVKEGRLAGRQPGVHLNKNGKSQAKQLAQYLAKTAVKAIYSSPLDRAVETAAPIAKLHKLSVLKRKALIEMDIGKWQGKTLKQVGRTKLWKVVQKNPSRARFPEGESFAEAQLRIAAELENIAVQHKSKDIVVCVGHSDMIKLAIAYYLGLPLDLFQRLTVQPASISTLVFHNSGTQIININYLPILTPNS